MTKMAIVVMEKEAEAVRTTGIGSKTKLDYRRAWTREGALSVDGAKVAKAMTTKKTS